MAISETVIDQDEGGPVSSFQSYAAEGDILAKQGDFRKSIAAYTKALNLRPNDKNALVARSKCHLLLGDSRAALGDAEASLKEEPDFFKVSISNAREFFKRQKHCINKVTLKWLSSITTEATRCARNWMNFDWEFKRHERPLIILLEVISSNARS